MGRCYLHLRLKVRGAGLRRLIANFFLVPDCDDQRHILLDMVESKIAAGAKANRPFPKLWVHIIDGTAGIGVVSNDFHPVTDRICRTSSRIGVFLGKKTIEALNICKRLGRPN